VSSNVEISRENRDFEIMWGVRTNAAWALAKMGNQSGISVLLELMETTDIALLRSYAQRLLKEITGKDYKSIKVRELD
ncbi:MAG: HEAT repeat domain-containing protein, partial [Bacteroidales bacterium]